MECFPSLEQLDFIFSFPFTVYFFLCLPAFRDGRWSSTQFGVFSPCLFPLDNSQEDEDLAVGVGEHLGANGIIYEPRAFLAKHAARRFRTGVGWLERLGKRAPF